MKFYAGVGSRETPEDVLDLMYALAVRLRADGWVLRSGGAQGADKAFEAGAGHAARIFRPEHAGAAEYEIAEQHHPAWDRCDGWARGLHARNVLQVLGSELEHPTGGPALRIFSSFVVCWAPTRNGVPQGGTAQAIRIAEAYGIPVRNLLYPETREAAERFIEGGTQ